MSTEALQLHLRSLHDDCLANLLAGLDAMSRGDLTVRAFCRTTPIETRADDPETQELVDLFNSTLRQTHAVLDAYNRAGERLRAGSLA